MKNLLRVQDLTLHAARRVVGHTYSTGSRLYGDAIRPPELSSGRSSHPCMDPGSEEEALIMIRVGHRAAELATQVVFRSYHPNQGKAVFNAMADHCGLMDPLPVFTSLSARHAFRDRHFHALLAHTDTSRNEAGGVGHSRK